MSHRASSLAFWIEAIETAGHPPVPRVATAVWLTPDGARTEPDATAVAAVVAQRRAAQVGVLVVGERATVQHDGLRCSAGLHAVRHADRIELGGCAGGVGGGVLWVSADVDATPQAFDPAAHGDDVFCQRTKKRLVAGEAIVVCPGTPRQSCGLPFLAAAWALGVPCHACGHDPRARRWRPPVARRRP